MTENDFLSLLSLNPTDSAPVVRWTVQTTGAVTASARLDFNEDSGLYEFGVYETLDRETTYTTGFAQRDRTSGEIAFRNDDDAEFFDRFVETVRVMQLDDKPGEEVES
jgi:hypothetical protein